MKINIRNNLSDISIHIYFISSRYNIIIDKYSLLINK